MSLMTTPLKPIKLTKLPKAKLIGRMTQEESDAFKLYALRKAAMAEAAEAYAEKLQRMAEGFALLEHDTWKKIEKRLDLDLNTNIYHVNSTSGKIYFEETKENRDQRERNSNPIARMIAAAKKAGV